MRTFVYTVALASILSGVASPRAAAAQVTASAGAFQLTIDAKGHLTTLRDRRTQREYLAPATAAPLITVVHAGQRTAPTGMSVTSTRGGKRLSLVFAPTAARLDVLLIEKPTHLVLRIERAEPAQLVDAIVWGPYPTTIGKTIGEIVGVVRDGESAFGLQVLNMKTLGGDLPNDEGSTWARGIAATRTTYGSTVQAYAINRDRVRTVDAWGGVYKRMSVAPIAGETVVGSAIALFGSTEEQTFDRLERIAIAEQLPRPLIDSVWFPKSSLYERSYMISSFGEADADEMLTYVKRSGLYSLYHEGPFKSWGHFILDSAQFPRGRAGMKAIVAKARAAGVHLGVHTLTNFINTNDPYVTPVPDDRLSVTGTSTLVQPISAQTTTIEVQSPEFFAPTKDNTLFTVKIGKELVQYHAVTDRAPFLLLDCQRGAFGTTPAAHAAGVVVGKLFDHPYKVFFPNFAMQREVASNLAAFLNETGVDHIDFDGHEGALASGQGDYALAVFADDVLKQTRHDLINGTSISKTFYWHIGSYYNWGEPWYGGFRESMQQYRIDNQALFDRNFMPHMLGWYLLTENTTLPEMEWMLARAAGYAAGFAMVARPRALRGNTNTPALLDAIREWEDARTTQAFTPGQRARLKDPANEFHLEKTADDAWNLYQFVLSPSFTREYVERQPGEPTTSRWRFEQSWPEQPVQFRVTLNGKSGSVRNLVMQIDRASPIVIPGAYNAGESLVIDGTTTVHVYDSLGKPKTRVQLPSSPPRVSPGPHEVLFDSQFSDAPSPTLTVQFKGRATPELVRRPRLSR
ncbi:MAG: hypothetical protein IT353_17500 [Gemmatimonadaceae bacterium]|nr:hypothetical protein [Gemmatimonadaceae bacterium]